MTSKPVRLKLPVWKKLVYATVVVAVFLLCLELLLRGGGWGLQPGPTEPVHAADTGGGFSPLQYFAVCDPYLGIRNRPSGSYHTWYVEGEPLVTTDEFGHRNGLGWPGDGQSPIVLFVGDSIVFGSEVDDQQTGPSEVARLLSEEFDVRVLNTGVRSYSTLQAKRMLLECFERFPRIKVAVYTFCGNDLEENVVPHFRYPFKAPYMVRDEQTGRFREVEVSEPAIPFGEPFLGCALSLPVPSTSEKLSGWLEARSALFYCCLKGWRRIDFTGSASVEFPDGKHQVPVSDYVKWHNWAAQNGGNNAIRQLLIEMDRICRKHGAAFVATCSFNGSDRGSCRAFETNCAEAGVRYVSLEQEFTDNPTIYICRRIDGMHDEHYGPLGTKTYANALAPALKQILRSQASTSVPEVDAAGHP